MTVGTLMTIQPKEPRVPMTPMSDSSTPVAKRKKYDRSMMFHSLTGEAASLDKYLRQTNMGHFSRILPQIRQSPLVSKSMV